MYRQALQVNEEAAYLQRWFCWQERKHYQNETNRELNANVIHNSTIPITLPLYVFFSSRKTSVPRPLWPLTLLHHGCSSLQPLFSMQIGSTYKHLSCFVIIRSKSPQQDQCLHPRGKSQKQTREMPSWEAGTACQNVGKNKEGLFHVQTLPCHYPPTALILEAKNNSKGICETS